MDGSAEAEANIRHMLYWDVINGVSRRCWSGNTNARQTIEQAMKDDEKLRVTIPNDLSDECCKKLNMS